MEVFAGLTDFLPWILRIFVVLFIFRLIRNAMTPAPTRQAPGGGSAGRRPGGAIERQGGQLVRDPQCGTYVPMSSSVQMPNGKDALYFCSTECRDAYRRARSSVA